MASEVYGDTNVFPSELDPETEEVYGPGKWIVEDRQMTMAVFDTEEDAAEFQRLFRIGNGLDPITGDKQG